MSAKREREEWRWKVGRVRGYLRRNDIGEGRWYILAPVKTPHGMVEIYHEPGHTALSVIRDGYEYHRVIRGPTYTTRGLTILAGRFAREVATATPTKAKSRTQRKR